VVCSASQNPYRGLCIEITVRQMLAQPVPALLPAVAASLAPARLRAFRRATEGHNRLALEMYLVDARLASTMHATFRAVEVLVREKMHRALSTAYSDRWFDVLEAQGLLDARTARKIAVPRQRGSDGTQPAAGKVVSRLMLGVWVELLDRGATGRYERELWPTLVAAFTSEDRIPDRVEVHHLAKRFAWARNRVNHCEPVVFGFPLVGERAPGGRQRRLAPAVLLEDVRTLAHLADPSVATWLRACDTVDDLAADPLAQRALDYIEAQPGVVLHRTVPTGTRPGVPEVTGR
jgi:hypothetical protein